MHFDMILCLAALSLSLAALLTAILIAHDEHKQRSVFAATAEECFAELRRRIEHLERENGGGAR